MVMTILKAHVAPDKSAQLEAQSRSGLRFLPQQWSRRFWFATPT